MIRDLLAAPVRTALLVMAVAASLAAVGTVLGARSILVREMATSYRSTEPASATLVFEGDVDREVLSLVSALPGVEAADAREVMVARIEVGSTFIPLLLFVADDLPSMRLNTIRSASGAWPPPVGSLLVERSALPLLGVGPGGIVTVKTPNGPPTAVPITGIVHDPGLAPASMERTVYGYIERATLATLGEPSVLHELRVRFAEGAEDEAAITAQADRLAQRLAEAGHRANEIRVPPPGKHPHQLQMETLLLVLVAFGVFALVLSGVVVANALSAMLARQIREIGVLKAIGARTSQIAASYALQVALIGAASVLLAAPLAWLGAQGQAGVVSAMLNFDLARTDIPAWVSATLLSAGLLVPLLLAAFPIGLAARAAVRDALDRHDTPPDALRPAIARLPRPAREVLRRPRRLLSNLVLLASGGAMFMAALDVAASWEQNLVELRQTRHYDAEIRLTVPEDRAVIDEVRSVEGVTIVEPWGLAAAAVARPGKVALTKTWPDRGHGLFIALAPPLNTTLVSLPLVSGRWLEEGDRDAVVLNHSARARFGGAEVGDRVELLVDDHEVALAVVGVVQEIGSPAAVYLTPQRLAQLTGTDAVKMMRVALSGRPGAHVLRDIEAALADRSVGLVLPFGELRTAVAEHIGVLVQMLLAMALILAIVGGIGLASSMAASVIERTREIGVLKAIGKGPARIVWDLVMEALVVAAGSAILAVVASLPVAIGMDVLLGQLGFLAPLPFVFDPLAALLWLLVVLAVAVAASVLPAWMAARMPVIRALAAL